MEIPISIDKKQYFKVILTVVQPVLKVKPNEARVLAILMALDYSNPKLPNDALLSSKVRKIVRNSIKMSKGSFNNVIYTLRKKNIIVGNNLSQNLKSLYPIGESTEIKYKITINNE
jgi:hypothetical protein